MQGGYLLPANNSTESAEPYPKAFLTRIDLITPHLDALLSNQVSFFPPSIKL